MIGPRILGMSARTRTHTQNAAFFAANIGKPVNKEKQVTGFQRHLFFLSCLFIDHGPAITTLLSLIKKVVLSQLLTRKEP